MHEHVTLLIRLGQIAGEPCSCEERASHALALLNAYTSRLYARVGIGASNRLATNAKAFADQALADLRREILVAEVHTGDSCRRIFTAVRHRIEMARRVLASRIVEEEIRPAPVPNPGQHLNHLRTTTTPHMRQDTEFEASPEPSLRSKKASLHRPCRRARLGSLSGQLTI